MDVSGTHLSSLHSALSIAALSRSMGRAEDVLSLLDDMLEGIEQMPPAAQLIPRAGSMDILV